MISIKSKLSEKISAIFLPVMWLFIIIGLLSVNKYFKGPVFVLMIIFFIWVLILLIKQLKYVFSKEMSLTNEGFFIGQNLIPWSEIKQIRIGGYKISPFGRVNVIVPSSRKYIVLTLIKGKKYFGITNAQVIDFLINTLKKEPVRDKSFWYYNDAIFTPYQSARQVR